ncbi:MAG: glycosyltransferase family 39 protein [Roseburia sp.]|nr:glycosyltransferase family 39 protein [Roseburia sp.]MCM1098404.1 glycosyltransferase family 39 protein [Ruminococcus flavefaciens]
MESGRTEKLTKLMLNIVFVFAIAFLAVLLIMQVNHSVTFDEAGKVIFVRQKAWTVALRAVLIIFVLMLSKQIGLTVGKKMFYMIGAVYILLNICLVFVLGLYPGGDQYYVTWIASDMMEGIYSQFEPYGYMNLYPFQYSFVSYVKLIFTLFGVNNYCALQILNVLYLWLIIYFVVKNTRFMFGEEQYQIGVVLMLFFPLSLYVTYIYGSQLSLALSLASAYYLLRFLTKEGKIWLNFLLVVVLNTFSVLIKNNALIFTIAELCLILLFSVKRAEKKIVLRNVLLAAAILGVYALSVAAANKSLARYTGSDKVGAPKTAWVAVGLQTGGAAEGWNNFFCRDVYWGNDCDAEATDTLSRAAIKESIYGFLKDPKYCVKFFYKKICSEWMNPSFDGIGIVEKSVKLNPNTEIRYSTPVRWFLSNAPGKSLDATHSVLNEYLRIYELAIFAGAFLYLIIRRLRVTDCLFMVVFIGGFLFHIFWEAACQYMLPYFVMLIPYGVMGLTDFRDIVAGRIRLFKRND